MNRRSPRRQKWLRVTALLLSLAGLYLVTVQLHQQREQIRNQPVALTSGCADKLAGYGLQAGEQYISPYIAERSGQVVAKAGACRVVVVRQPSRELTIVESENASPVSGLQAG